MNSKQPLKRIGVLNYCDFPEGMAATTRIVSYSKGLIHNGIEVESVIFRPRLDTAVSPASGEVEGVRYHYCYTRPKNRFFITKILLDRPKALIKACRYVIARHFDWVLLSFDQLKYLLFFVPVLSAAGIKLVFIGDEFPHAIREKQRSRVPGWQLLLYKAVSAGIKARILINPALHAFYDEKVCPKPTHILSTIIDTDRFPLPVDKESEREPYFCYMGGMQLNNDNVDNIILAYALLKDCSIPLYLYGAPSSEDIGVIEALIRNKGLTDRVFFKGRASYAEVPAILSQATMLLTSQADSLRARGGLPTKLGEYMLSGTPFIATDVGDIACFVKDGETGYLVRPCDPASYAEKIEYVLSHDEEAQTVALNGREYVIRNYSADKQAKGMIVFLQNLK